MWGKITLGSVIEDFMKEHPNYILDILDLETFERHFTNSFIYTTVSMNNAAIKYDAKLKQYADENQKLREENEQLKKKLKE